jgi:hypothetical protein
VTSSFNNTSIFTKRADGARASPHTTSLIPLLCLLAAMVLLSSITPAIKYVFEHSDLHLATLRVTIGFFVLTLTTMLWDRGGAKEVVGRMTVPLALLGLLGVDRRRFLYHCGCEAGPAGRIVHRLAYR